MTEISDDLLTQCMHCGLCLPVCPTYALTGLEKSSPRGRIRLMKSVMDGTLPVSETFKYEMDFCLDCQACQTACPAGVKYGELVESARILIESGKNGFSLKRLTLKKIFGGKSGLRKAAALLRFYQKSGLEKGVLALSEPFSGWIFNRARLLPRISEKFSIDILPEIIEPKSKMRGTVAVLTGCVMDAIYADVNIDTVEVLAENGWRVAVPHSQVCCGSVNGHSGDVELAKSLAAKNIDAFEKTGADYYVVNSAGCSAFMKEYGKLLEDDPRYFGRAKRFSARVKEFSEFLFETGYRKPRSRLDVPVTYHEPCHLVHTQKISTQPRAMVNEIAGDNYRELNEATWCCGSAGIYNLTHCDDASRLLDRKLGNIGQTGANMVITGNPGCMAQIAAGIKNDGMDVEVVHPATVLNRLYKIDKA
jgi:glycolate dehydrogenase iron-sulfur subunit